VKYPHWSFEDELENSNVGPMMNDRLRLFSRNEPLMLGQLDGSEMLGQATDVFKYIDRNFEGWNCNMVGPPTQETPVRVYEMARDSTFQELFGGFGLALDSLALTQAQIKQFARYYGNWLKKGGNGTFFLFRVGNDFFVAAVYFFSDGGLGIRVRGLDLERVFRAQKGHRLVVKSR
jgi:hypothetical protein